jgi:hypothetical protein
VQQRDKQTRKGKTAIREGRAQLAPIAVMCDIRFPSQTSGVVGSFVVIKAVWCRIGNSRESFVLFGCQIEAAVEHDERHVRE